MREKEGKRAGRSIKMSQMLGIPQKEKVGQIPACPPANIEHCAQPISGLMHHWKKSGSPGLSDARRRDKYELLLARILIICCDMTDRPRRNSSKKWTDLSQIIQRLLIDSILFKGCLAVFDYIVHDALVHGTL